MTLLDFDFENAVEASSRAVRLRTIGGEVQARYYPSAGAKLACLWVPGAIGGWHSPACGLYPRLARDFAGEQIASIQVSYRVPGDWAECVADVLAGIEFLARQGGETVGVIGHSFGGAVVLDAASQAHCVRTAVALSTQSCGAVEPARRLGPHCSILLVHGASDEILPVSCSQHIYRAAREPKKLLVIPATRHGLDEAADQLFSEVGDWLRTELRKTR
jgi:dienelactone hydrolase